jgi:hypothetical protein
VNGLALDCGIFRWIIYSLIAGLVLAFPAVFFMESEYLLIYLFAASLVPVSAMLFTLACSIRCASSSRVLPKETITVAVKFAMDTLQLLELGGAEKYAGEYKPKTDAKGKKEPLAGTHRFCLLSKFTLYYDMIAFPAILLFAPALSIYFLDIEEAGVVSVSLALILTSIFLFAFWVEYYTCCKRHYPASCEIWRAKIVRCPFVSYIELEMPRPRKP